MLVKFNDIARTYGIPNGVIHIGAHKMQERSDYIGFGIKNILWVEANPSLYDEAKAIIGDSESESIYSFAASDNDHMVYKFKIGSDDQASSIFDFFLHKNNYPHIYTKKTISVKSKRMDTLIKEESIDISKYNFLNFSL